MIKNNKKYVSKRIKCDNCEKKFNKTETFEKHMKQVHGSKSQSQSEMTLLKVLRSSNNNKMKSSAQDSINWEGPLWVETCIDVS